MVPYWRGDSTIAIIDGSRLLLFDLDIDYSYWMNPKSRPSGFPLSTGKHEQNKNKINKAKAYNYPNPILEGNTTFRFYIDNLETDLVQINIYNASGHLVNDNLFHDNIVSYEYNEIQWNDIQLNAGLYFAEIKPNIGESELIKLVLIKCVVF